MSTAKNVMKLAGTTESFNKWLGVSDDARPRDLLDPRDLFGLIDLFANDLQVQGIEIDSRQIVDRSKQGLNRIKHACVIRGMTIASLCAYNNFGYRDRQRLDEELESVKRTLDLAAAIGCPLVRVFAGHAEDSSQKQWSSMIDSLGRACGFAESAGVVLGMENHNDEGFAQTAEDVERIFADVGSDWLRLNLDTANYTDGMRSIRTTAPHIVHVHLKCIEVDQNGKETGIEDAQPLDNVAKMVKLSGGESQYLTDLARVLVLLKETNYRGFVSVEYEGEESALTAVPRAVKYVRGLLRERN